MISVSCAYCSDSAVGYDSDDEPTCGNAAHCTASVRPMPAVIEVSAGDDEEDDEASEEA